MTAVNPQKALDVQATAKKLHRFVVKEYRPVLCKQYFSSRPDTFNLSNAVEKFPSRTPSLKNGEH